MQFQMKMPDLATTESEIRIVRWIVQPGQNVARGEPLLEVETDKATMEVESVASGVLGEVRSQVGESVSVGDVIAVLEVEGEARPSVSAGVPRQRRRRRPAAAASPVTARARCRKRPLARSACLPAIRAAAAAAEGRQRPGIPLSVAQRTAAQRLQESKQTIPHFYLQTSVNACGDHGPPRGRRTASSWPGMRSSSWPRPRRSARFERFRCRLDGERLVPVETDAIGVAVDEDNELFVIPVAVAGRQDGASRSPTRSARRRAAPQRRPGVPAHPPGPVTVTNLGVCNVERFVPDHQSAGGGDPGRGPGRADSRGHERWLDRCRARAARSR